MGRERWCLGLLSPNLSYAPWGLTPTRSPGVRQAWEVQPPGWASGAQSRAGKVGESIQKDTQEIYNM